MVFLLGSVGQQILKTYMTELLVKYSSVPAIDIKLNVKKKRFEVITGVL